MRKLIIAALCAVAGSAVAAMSTSFKEADTDRDGYISAEEAKAVEGLAARFEQADTNKYGRLDEAEYAAIAAAAEGAGGEQR